MFEKFRSVNVIIFIKMFSSFVWFPKWELLVWNSCGRCYWR